MSKIPIAASVLALMTLNMACSLLPRNLTPLDEEINWVTYASPAGLEVRLPNGVDIYAFRLTMLHGGLLVGGGVELAQVVYMKDSETYISLFSPYIYYAPVGIVEPERYGPDEPLGLRMRIMTFLYAGGSFLSIPRNYDPLAPKRIHMDFGAGLTFKKIDLRLGALFKYRKSTDTNAFFPYLGLNYNFLGPRWNLEW